jgi:hypothetical protein
MGKRTITLNKEVIKMKKSFAVSVVLGLMLASAPSLSAQALTGVIRGNVLDPEGIALPGATVTASSPQTLGVRNYITDNKGEFILRSLTPGEYSIKVELSGFQTTIRSGLIVQAGKTITIKIELKTARIAEEVTVVAPSPVVDITTTKEVTTIERYEVESIPSSRNITDIVNLVPGTIGETSQDVSAVKGSTTRSNIYAVDGVNINDPSSHTSQSRVNFDDIEEVEVITGAKPAEIGPGGGAYINVVTKTGGNKYSGGILIRYTDASLKKPLMSEEKLRSLGLGLPTYDKYNLDTSLTFGGPILKDKLSFFMAARRYGFVGAGGFTPFTDPLGNYHDNYEFGHQDRYGSIKLNYQATPNLKFAAFFSIISQWQPYDKTPQWSTPAESLGRIARDKGTVASGIIDWIISQNSLLEIKIPYAFRGSADLLQKESENLPYYKDDSTRYLFGSAPYNSENEKARFNPTINFTTYAENLLGGSHEFKIGFEYEYAYMNKDWWKQDPINWFYFNGDPHRYVDSNPIFGYLTAYITGPNKGDNITKDNIWRFGAYAQDSFRIGRRLSLNIGLRYDESHAFKPRQMKKGITAQLPLESPGLLNMLLPDLFSENDIVVEPLKDLIVWKDISPRIGVTYDLFGNGKTALKASFSRYTEFLQVAWTQQSNPFPVQNAQINWYDNNANGKLDLPPIDDYTVLHKPIVEPDVQDYRKKIASNMKSPYTDEFIIGIEREVYENVRIGLDYTYKYIKRVVEDVDINNPLDGDMWIPYTVKDPGWDRKLGTGDDKDLTVYWLNSGTMPYYQLQNIPQARRKYQGLCLTLDKRMSNNWGMGASVLYSRIYGNYSGLLNSTSGYSSAYNNPNGLVNTDKSRLDYDKPWAIKIYGSGRLPWDFYVSGFFTHFSGNPYYREVIVYFPSTIDGFTPYYTNSGRVWAEVSGTHRQEAADNLDMKIERAFDLRKIGLRGILKAGVDIFNVLGNTSMSIQGSPLIYIYADGSTAVSSNYGRLNGISGTRAFVFSVNYTF